MAPVNVGIIGYGFSTKTFQLPFILPVKDLHVYAFLQRKSPEPSKPHCTQDFPGSKWYQHEDDFFADRTIHTVIVCTQPDSHAHFARRALQSGKNVVVEKPFTCTSAEADELIALAAKTGRLLTCYQNRRLDGDFLTIRALLAERALGEIVDFESHFDLDAPGAIPQWDAEEGWVPGAGMLFGLAAHTIDQALLLFGRPRTVTAFTRALRTGAKNRKIDDAHTVILEYDGDLKDLLVTIKSTVISAVKEQLRFIIRGRDGSYIKHHLDYQEAQVLGPESARVPVTDPSFGIEPISHHGTLVTFKPAPSTFCSEPQIKDTQTGRYVGTITTAKGNWVGYYENLAAVLSSSTGEENGKNEQILVKASEARDVIRLIELARESAELGRGVEWS